MVCGHALVAASVFLVLAAPCACNIGGTLTAQIPLNLLRNEHVRLESTDPAQLTFYGQDKEDEYAYRTFFSGERHRHGTFLELGALNGRIFSNTLFFEERGWQGLLIEPTQALYEQLIQNRPHSICVRAAICNTVDAVHLVEGHRVGGAVNGIWEFMSEGFRKRWWADLDPTTLPTVACVPLGSLLRLFRLTHINFFSLDVEGAELAVLRTVDFSQTMFDVVVIEADGSDHAKEADIKALLERHGYQLHAHVQRNDWFVRADFVAHNGTTAPLVRHGLLH